MATAATTITFLLDQLADLPHITTRKMFGEYCVYVAGKPVALVCDDQLYLKPTAAAQAMIAHVQTGLPYPGAKPHLWISADLWDDRDWLCQLINPSSTPSAVSL